MKDLRDWYSYLERAARSAAVSSHSSPPIPAASVRGTTGPAPRRRAGRRPQTETREEIIRRLLDPDLALHEAAAVLNLSKATVRRYTLQGKLRCFRTAGGQRRFRLSDVLALLGEPPPREERR